MARAGLRGADAPPVALMDAIARLLAEHEAAVRQMEATRWHLTLAGDCLQADATEHATRAALLAAIAAYAQPAPVVTLGAPATSTPTANGVRHG